MLRASDYEALILKLEDRNFELEKELEAFWTGVTPEKATMAQVVLAKWGKKRREDMLANEG